MKDDTDELALAAYAAETGSHVLIAPREARFARFRERFDGPAFRKRLAEAEICWLARSDPAFPHALTSIFDPPAGLFVRRGGGSELFDRPAVAIVGARACSPYGLHVARTFGRELAAAGLVVVSGMARGVDGEAHRGALDAGGVTVAVLGCGVDRDYPAVHAELARRICADGLVVSEYAPGVEPAPWRFPARKRRGWAASRFGQPSGSYLPYLPLNALLVWSRCGLGTSPFPATAQALRQVDGTARHRLRNQIDVVTA
jgi:DNA processing protein